MLRSTVVQSDTPVYSAAWSPDSSQVLHTSGKMLVIKHLAPNSKPSRVWDTYGRQLYSSHVHDYPITSVSWAPSGDLFAVGSYNTLRLCDKAGWSYSLEKPNTGSIFNIAWSSDGTQVAGACGNGHVIFAHIIERHFLLVEKSSMNLYSYEGRLLCSPRWQGMQPETLNAACVSLSPDTIVVRDQADDKLLHIFELGTARSLVEAPPLRHSGGVIEVALNQAGSPSERQLVLVDKNRDLYLTYVRGSSKVKLRKLGSMIQSLCWNSESNILAAVQDTNLIVWNYPPVLFVDKRLIKKTVIEQDSSHMGVRRVDGSLVNSGVSPYPSILHGYVSSSRWDDALRLCRFVKDLNLWACLAAMATYAKELTTAEEAYAAINELDKVAYLQHIKAIPIQAVQSAEMALLGGNVHDAENLLLQNGLVFRSIMTNLHLHNWNRALELAMKHKTHVDTVLFFRKKYLDGFGKEETNEKFLQFKNEVELDAEKIANKIEKEYQREGEKGSNKS
ncbi:hypothetical protein C0J52_07301 [Blattella germanica]|nr:hypothetical protein C0J52_07301 [Blattella germanica]